MNISFAITNIIKDNKKGLVGIYNNKSFDPLTAIWDLVMNAKGEDCDSNIQIVVDDFKRIFDISVEGQDFSDYFKKAIELRGLIACNMLSLSQLELLKPYYGLTFNMSAVYNTSSVCGEIQPIKPFKFDFCSMETALDNIVSDENFFVYNCYSIVDVPFAILHYLLLNEYKFRECEHCGKIFATKTLKQKYCTRKSPYPKKQHLECKEAAKNIMTHITQRKNGVYTNLERNHSEKAEDFNKINEFIYRKDKNTGEKNIGRSVSALKYLEYILSETYVNENWYTDTNKQHTEQTKEHYGEVCEKHIARREKLK